MAQASQLAAFGILALCIVSGTVLAALKVVPGDLVLHALGPVVGGALMYLNPSMKKESRDGSS